MHFLTKKHISRRRLLRGAGVALALPLLDSMLPAATARAAELATPRPRLGCIYIPHGTVHANWEPTTVGTNFAFTPTLKSLEPFRDRITVVTGLDLQTAYEGPPSAGEHHNRSSRCWLTCVPPGKGPSPTSMDQLAADHIGQDTDSNHPRCRARRDQRRAAHAAVQRPRALRAVPHRRARSGTAPQSGDQQAARRHRTASTPLGSARRFRRARKDHV